MTIYKDFAPTALDAKGLGLSDRQDWIVACCSVTRDSEPLERANWQVMLECLGGESDRLEIHRFGHWGPGWFDIALIAPDATDLLAEHERIECALADYPVLCDETFSRLETEDREQHLPSWASVASDLREIWQEHPGTIAALCSDGGIARVVDTRDEWEARALCWPHVVLVSPPRDRDVERAACSALSRMCTLLWEASW
jgi:hypothetical protein